MKENFDKCLEMLLHHEGGYVNHPKDPGGETNLGVTKRVYEDWGGTKDMKALTIEDVAPIYKKKYWDLIKGDELPSGVDWCAFDWAVNSGVSRSAKALQKISGAEQDGVIGRNSLALISKVNPEFLIKEFFKLRQDFYESLDTFETFGRGWTTRNKETTDKSLSLVQ